MLVSKIGRVQNNRICCRQELRRSQCGASNQISLRHTARYIFCAIRAAGMMFLLPHAHLNRSHKYWRNSHFSLCQDALSGLLGDSAGDRCGADRRCGPLTLGERNYTNTVFVISSLLYLPKHKPKPKHRKPVKASDISKIL